MSHSSFLVWNMNPIAWGDSVVEDIKCWSWCTLFSQLHGRLWHICLYKRSGGMSPTAELLVWGTNSDCLIWINIAASRASKRVVRSHLNSPTVIEDTASCPASGNRFHFTAVCYHIVLIVVISRLCEVLSLCRWLLNVMSDTCTVAAYICVVVQSGISPCWVPHTLTFVTWLSKIMRSCWSCDIGYNRLSHSPRRDCLT